MPVDAVDGSVIGPESIRYALELVRQGTDLAPSGLAALRMVAVHRARLEGSGARVGCGEGWPTCSGTP